MSAPKRNIYRDEVDFSALALQDPDFNKFVKSNGQLDFSNPEAVQQLTKSLLKRDFGLKLELPDDRLCPPVPNRLNYIIWVQDLLDSSSGGGVDEYDPDREVIGLDIGTGASCIYPLLGCALRPNWRFAVTDIDAKSLEYAKRNITINNMRTRIRPLKTTPESPLVPLDAFGLESIDVTICNPPFYSSASDLLASASLKSRPPNSACTGAPIEMVTPGGEIAFISRLITESLSPTLRTIVQWFTTMLGKHSSLTPLITLLNSKGCTNYAVTEFVQGGKTKRWGLGWSWGTLRPKMDVARGVGNLPKHLLPFPSEISIAISFHPSDRQILEILEPLRLRNCSRISSHAVIGATNANVWSRSARRRATIESKPGGSMDDAVDESASDDAGPEPALSFRIDVSFDGDADSSRVTVRWLQGTDHVLFESFCGWLKRKLGETGR